MSLRVKVFPHYYTGRKVIEEKPVAEVPNKDCSNSPNTATKIKLQCSKFKWGYGSTFTYWGQKVRKINEDWDNNNSLSASV